MIPNHTKIVFIQLTHRQILVKCIPNFRKTTSVWMCNQNRDNTFFSSKLREICWKQIYVLKLHKIVCWYERNKQVFINSLKAFVKKEQLAFDARKTNII